MMEALTNDALAIALDRIDGHNFEEFAHVFWAAIVGNSFVPLGGMHDGGADAFAESIYSESSIPEFFFQFSIQDNYRSKIRDTAARLKQTGRKVKGLIYGTNQVVPEVDKVELELARELDMSIYIRDRKYIVANAYKNNATRDACEQYLRPQLQFLFKLGSSALIDPPKDTITDPSVFVFMQQEIDARTGHVSLQEAVTDSLILWALNDTDPDSGKFLTREEIRDRIITAVPWAKQFLDSTLDHRIRALETKAQGSRSIRWYRKHGKGCLPYETRLAVTEENEQDEKLRVLVLEELTNIASNQLSDQSVPPRLVADLAIKTVEKLFMTEGLQFAYFLQMKDSNETPKTVDDCISEVLSECGIGSATAAHIGAAIHEVVRNLFYNSTENQRLFLGAMSRTYILLFALRADPRIVEYFSSMTEHFRLFVGTDILVRALTERYLKREDQLARNALKLASEAGATLLLAEPVLEEIYTHLRATCLEFYNNYAEVEPYITRDIASQSDKVLIRTYFYAKESGAVSGWKTFINQFVTYDEIMAGRGKDELLQYLVAQFDLEYFDKSELMASVNSKDVEQLANRLAEYKSRTELAYNDALMVCTVYGQRRNRKEAITASEYGLETWWLTKEIKILDYTWEIVQENHSRYLMRPEYLIHFFALAPSKAEIVKSYRSIFPTIIGLQMGHRLKPEMFSKVIEQVKECKDLEEGRRRVKMGHLSDELKSNRLKMYSSAAKQITKDFDQN